MSRRYLAPLVIAALVSGVRLVQLSAGTSRPAAGACGDSTAISWEPGAPQQGALFRVRVAKIPTDTRLSGTAAGEQLHFTPDTSANGEFESFGAVPIDGPISVPILVRCASGGATDSLTVHLTAATASYPVEHLHVAPAYATPPDSALAARIQRESDRAYAVARQSHATPQLWTKPFTRPRPTRITSGFGDAREFNGTITSRHMGTDFAGVKGAPVQAANRGVVRIVGSFFYGGNVIYVDHGAGLTSAYLHLSQQLVVVGDTVERGQVIGKVGATGRVTGPHLHLIVRYGGVTVDPLSLFALAGVRQ